MGGGNKNPWFRIGTLIGRHMVVVAPLCVALGVAFPSLFSWISPAVSAMFAFMTFQNSLATTSRELLGVVRRPVPLLANLLVLFVAMPLIALLAGRLIVPDQPAVVAGMVIECCVPMGVTGLMWVDIYNGDRPFALAAVIVSTLLAPFTMPLTLQLLVGASVHVDVAAMMRDLAVMVALPAVAGMACNDLSHGKANERVAPWLAPASKLMLVAILLANSTRISDTVRNLTPQLVGIVAVMALLSGLGYVLGYLVARLLRRDAAVRITMGVTCGVRNITSGAVLAAAYFPHATMFPVLMGTLFQHIMAGIFGWAVARLDGRGEDGRGPGGGGGEAREGDAGPQAR